MAEAFGKLARRPAALFVSRGPGSSNAAIGIHSAKQASRALVLFVANIPRPLKQREAFQEKSRKASWGSAYELSRGTLESRGVLT